MMPRRGAAHDVKAVEEEVEGRGGMNCWKGRRRRRVAALSWTFELASERGRQVERGETERGKEGVRRRHGRRSWKTF